MSRRRYDQGNENRRRTKSVYAKWLNSLEIKGIEEPDMPGLFVLAGTALRAKFVLLNLQGELTFSVPDHPSAGNQIQKALFIQLRRPAN